MKIKLDSKYKLIRVIYGKKETPEKDREYKLNGIGAVGNLKEWKDFLPTATFEIVDNINGVDSA